MKLFAIYIGGSTETSLIEVHDVRFAAAARIEDTEDFLKSTWWGKPSSLHMDCWGELTSADGHDIHLKTFPAPEGQGKVYFVNLGGYDPAEFTELHKNIFVVAENESKAKVRALKTILDWKGHHKDNLYEVENIFCVNEALRDQSLYIHLEKTETPRPFTFTYGYMPIGKKY